ncbi:MAG TPA: LysE family translocator [Cryptosporangiaceae bacterium]|nr:LysE family translocator [Cryptosporangiaceae bacterium]
MDWSSYGSFVAFAVVLVLIPGADFAVVTKNAVAGGRRRAAWTSVGVTTSNIVQGLAAALGLGAVILRSQPLFEAVRWAGVAYLAYLGIQALRSAIRGAEPVGRPGPAAPGRVAMAGWRQGFLSNITNPKVLAFYLAVLPQFLTPGSRTVQVLAFALTHAVLGLLWLLLVVVALDRARGWLARPRVRRAMDAVTGTLLLGFSVRLATEHR